MISLVERLPYHEYWSAVGNGGNQGHMSWMGWIPDIPDPNSMFEPQFAEFPQLYRNDELMELLEQAHATTDRDERLRLYGEVDRLVVAEHAAVAPLIYPTDLLTRRPWVSGVWDNGHDMSSLDEAVVDVELRNRLRPPGAGSGIQLPDEA